MEETKKDDITPEKVFKDFHRAYAAKRSTIDKMQSDFEFFLGKQWPNDAIQELKERKIKPLTINRIFPIVQLLTGLESQNRPDYKAFPEGEEDTLKAEVVTRLLKNVMKVSEADYKISEMFEDGTVCGESALEPYLDHTESLINGEFRVKKGSYFQIIPDPESTEYDYSDAEFICKIIFDLTKEKLLVLYPDSETEIENLQSGKISLEVAEYGGAHIQRKDYTGNSSATSFEEKKDVFDLLEYKYKKYVKKYFVGDFKLNKIVEMQSKQDAEAFVEQATALDQDPNRPSAKVIPRLVPEIWNYAITGGLQKPLYHGPEWSYPRWKGYPIIPFAAYTTNTRVNEDDRHLLKKGVTRNLIDLNFEENKTRTQELHILNTTANSGWQGEEDAFVDEEETWKKFGSKPGIILKHKQGFAPPIKIIPNQLPVAHDKLAQRRAEDLKEASGINTDLLAVEDGGQSSGRAIALRQKQGMVMVQRLFDNLRRSRKILAKFILSQLPEIFDVETAMRVVGDAFLQQNFSKPVQGLDPMSGQVVVVPQFDQAAAMQFFNEVLTDPDLPRYDVAVGENIGAETVQYANWLLLQDMVQAGVPVPPSVLVEKSGLDESTRKQIQKAVEAQAALPPPGSEKKQPQEAA